MKVAVTLEYQRDDSSIESGQADSGRATPNIHPEFETFGGCEIRPKLRELRRDGKLQHLPRKVFDCLQYLIAHRDRVVSKNELVDAVWQVYSVSDSVIARSVMKARRAIGDDAASPSMIKTVHGIGYRFIAPIVRISGSDSTRLVRNDFALSSVQGHFGLRHINSPETCTDSQEGFSEWAFQRALRAVGEDRWNVAIQLFELAISLGYGKD